MATQHTKFDRHSIRVWISWCVGTLWIFSGIFVSGQNNLAWKWSAIKMIFCVKFSRIVHQKWVIVSQKLVKNHFWWTILDNFTQNIIFTADNFDATCFNSKTKIQEKIHCAMARYQCCIQVSKDLIGSGIFALFCLGHVRIGSLLVAFSFFGSSLSFSCSFFVSSVLPKSVETVGSLWKLSRMVFRDWKRKIQDMM